MKMRPTHLAFSGLIGIMLCLLANNMLYAASGEGNQTAPAAIDLALIQEDLAFLKEETVSIAIMHEQPISEAPSNVYVITAEDIQHSGATDIPTILRRIPGMEVMQMTAADFNVSVRGNNQTFANKLLVLVDGRAIYEYALGSVFWTLIPVTLPEIKRIEVWKGPASAIFGFNAFDGVVNIITKSPEEMKGTTNGTFAQVGVGELGTIRSAAIQSGNFGNFGYRLSYGHDQSQKFDNRDALGLRVNKFNVQTEYDTTNNSKILLSGGLMDSNRFDGQVLDIVRESSDITNGYVNASYEQENFFIRGSWTRWDITRKELLNPPILNNFGAITDRNGNIPEDFTHDVFTLWVQHALDLPADHRFTYGVNYFHNHLFNANIIRNNSAREDRVGMYLQDEWRMMNMVTVVAGVRMDLHDELNPTYSPRLALIYKPAENHTFRTSVSVAYRPPSLLETRLDQRNVVFGFGPGFALVGSSNLDPEQIISYEAGYQGWFLKHRLRVRLDGFFNHLSDFIGATTTGPPTFQNLGEADIYGGEAGIEFLAFPWLTGFLNYSTVQLHQTSDLVAQQGFVTRGAPSYKISGGLRADLDNGLNGEATVHHVTSTSYPISNGYPFFFAVCGGCFTQPQKNVGAYTLVNLRGAYRFWEDRAELALSVFNALNDRHRENPVGEVLKSRVMAWLTLKY